MVPYIARFILFDDKFINKPTGLCVAISSAYRGIGLNRLHKVSKAHISFVRNFSKGVRICIPRKLRFVSGPMRRRR